MCETCIGESTIMKANHPDITSEWFAWMLLYNFY